MVNPKSYLPTWKARWEKKVRKAEAGSDISLDHESDAMHVHVSCISTAPSVLNNAAILQVAK